MRPKQLPLEPYTQGVRDIDIDSLDSIQIRHHYEYFSEEAR